MRKALALGTTAASLVALALTGTPAFAAEGTTTVSFAVVEGTLAIVVTPAAAAVNTTVVGTSKVANISLGVTTINDTRSSGNNWNYSAKTTDFTSTVISPAVTIAKTNAAFSIPAAPTSTLGSPTFTNQKTAPTAVAADGTSGVLLTGTAASANDATFTPFLQVTLPASTPLATFTGTVTQSVV